MQGHGAASLPDALRARTVPRGHKCAARGERRVQQDGCLGGVGVGAHYSLAVLLKLLGVLGRCGSGAVAGEGDEQSVLVDVDARAAPPAHVLDAGAALAEQRAQGKVGRDAEGGHSVRGEQGMRPKERGASRGEQGRCGDSLAAVSGVPCRKRRQGWRFWQPLWSSSVVDRERTGIVFGVLPVLLAVDFLARSRPHSRARAAAMHRRTRGRSPKRRRSRPSASTGWRQLLPPAPSLMHQPCILVDPGSPCAMLTFEEKSGSGCRGHTHQQARVIAEGQPRICPEAGPALLLVSPGGPPGGGSSAS